ncbi:MAG: hypothetical protein ABI183_22060 [Polyangiaceae bacterium]
MTFRDLIIVITAIVSCALLITAQISIIAALAVRPPRWRALAVIAFPPLAPYWAFREKLRGRAITWLLSAVIYVIARLLAQ